VSRRAVHTVIGGAGEVGYHLASTLVREGHNVAIIEATPTALQRAERLDVALIPGNVARMDLLARAEVDKADVFVAVTGNDEANMVAASLAKSMGAKRTIARVNNPDFLSEASTERYRRIGIDVTVCPELVAAERIRDALAAPDLMNVDLFAERRVHVMEIRAPQAGPGVGRSIRELELPEGVNLLAVSQQGDTQVARGDVIIRPRARLLAALRDPADIFVLKAALGDARSVPPARPIRRVMIAGATRIGIHLARILERDKSVTIVDEDDKRCAEASVALDKTLVIQGNATDRRVLLDEDVREMDAFVGAARVEEYNILSALLAKNLGVPRAIALVNQAELRDLVEDLDVDLAVDPKRATVGAVLRHLTDMQAVNLIVTRGGEGQILEVVVQESSRVAGKTLAAAALPRDSVCAAIVRGGEVILPRGTDIFAVGDRVVLYAKPAAIPEIEERF
jgi:trk system potassium uptake protein